MKKSFIWIVTLSLTVLLWFLLAVIEVKVFNLDPVKHKELIFINLVIAFFSYKQIKNFLITKFM